MPGRRYLDSIRKFWRTFAADDDISGEAARKFLESFTDTASFPLSRLGGTTASEMAKLLENSYRASNIAFIHEWTLLAEKVGVNLWEVVDAIRVRKGTHDNMRYPGFGVGGYCLTKDSYLAQWGAKNLLGLDCDLPVTLSALSTNYAMPLHTLDLVRECAGGSLSGLRILLCGVSYLADVADTRNSPSLQFADAALGEGAVLFYHDSLVEVWPERGEIPRISGIAGALPQFDAVVFAVPHAEYLSLKAEDFPPGMIVVDSSNIVDDPLAGRLRLKGCRIAGAGKGHWRERKWHLIS
jgi:UDP-N-acetyl-D-glucosamine dehydrogenase